MAVGISACLTKLADRAATSDSLAPRFLRQFCRMAVYVLAVSGFYRLSSLPVSFALTLLVGAGVLALGWLGFRKF